MMQNISETQVLGLLQLSWLEHIAELQGEKIIIPLQWGPSSNCSFCLGDDE